ncbi:MAG: hypothetical protein BWY09_01255 [Candidatus Hydrogenedentes bacterium ADurb.Bin179]|nr:MAG: hypothetical protein BWY09_01255 [Candidatus Hydrogenedentes bacterium ADurb.Bin179]
MRVGARDAGTIRTDQQHACVTGNAHHLLLGEMGRAVFGFTEARRDHDTCAHTAGSAFANAFKHKLWWQHDDGEIELPRNVP